jgi:hypothetical protein
VDGSARYSHGIHHCPGWAHTHTHTHTHTHSLSLCLSRCNSISLTLSRSLSAHVLHDLPSLCTVRPPSPSNALDTSWPGASAIHCHSLSPLPRGLPLVSHHTVGVVIGWILGACPYLPHSARSHGHRRPRTLHPTCSLRHISHLPLPSTHSSGYHAHSGGCGLCWAQSHTRGRSHTLHPTCCPPALSALSATHPPLPSTHAVRLPGTQWGLCAR